MSEFLTAVLAKVALLAAEALLLHLARTLLPSLVRPAGAATA
ncbi:hypothetical protein ACFW9F_25260 [Streptomyces sp. NPDC059506]|nr:hypothetical protein [Streptomyces sp. SCUT-3]